MMALISAWLKEHMLDWLKEFPKHFLPFGIFAAISLFAPDTILSKIGIIEIRNQYKPYLGAVLVLSITFVLSAGLTFAWDRAKEMMNNRLKKRKVIERLRQITPEEADILGEYLEKKTYTLTLGLTDGVAMGLAKSGIIWQASNMTYDPGACDFNISPWIWIYLNSNPEIISAHKSPLKIQQKRT